MTVICKRKLEDVFLTAVLVIFGLSGVVSLTLAQGDTWTRKADMLTARRSLSTSVVNGKIYAIGGAGGSSTVEQYNPATDSWTAKPPMPTARLWLSASAVDGKIYAIGGTPFTGAANLSTVEAYDPVTDTWTEKAPIPTARFTHSTSVVDGKIYAIGGIIRATRRGSEQPSSDVEAYDPVTDTWAKKAPMPTARGFIATGVVNGKIFAIGGATAGGAGGLSTVEMYDPLTDTWTTKASMPTPRATCLAASTVNGIIYVIGGVTGHSTVAAVEAYDPATNIWTKKTSMPTRRAFLATSAVNGKIYAIGGALGSPWGGISRVEEYDTGFVVNVTSRKQNNPTVFVLYQNYPNPFNPETRITYEVSSRDRVVLKVFNLLGQQVRSLVEEEKPFGSHEVVWDGKNDFGQRVANGVYLYKFEATGFVQTRKMVLLK